VPGKKFLIGHFIFSVFENVVVTKGNFYHEKVFFHTY
jgi:hypothetical protein